MALKRVELSDETLMELSKKEQGATFKDAKELGESIEKYLAKGFNNAVDLNADNLFLINSILDFAKRSGKESEVQEIIKNALKDINLKLIREI